MSSLCFSLGVPAPPKRKASVFRCTPRCALTAVAGATGKVGRLLVKELCEANVTVRALVRNESTAREMLPEQVAYLQVGSYHAEGSIADLRAALRDVETLYICVGSTAYPTRRWFQGDTPQTIDIDGVRNLLECSDKQTLKRVVYISSIGVLRRKSFPFALLNLFGVLDAKRCAEEAVKACGANYALVRLGKLNDTPIEKPAIFYRGDVGAGDLSRALAAKVLRFCGEVEDNLEFSIMEAEENSTTKSFEEDELMAGIASISS